MIECAKLWHDYRGLFNEPLEADPTALIVCFDESTWVLAKARKGFYLVEVSSTPYQGAIEMVTWPKTFSEIADALKSGKDPLVVSRDEAIYRRRLEVITYSCGGNRVLGVSGESRIRSCGECFVCFKDDLLISTIEELGLGRISKAQAFAIKSQDQSEERKDQSYFDVVKIQKANTTDGDVCEQDRSRTDKLFAVNFEDGGKSFCLMDDDDSEYVYDRSFRSGDSFRARG